MFERERGEENGRSSALVHDWARGARYKLGRAMRKRCAHSCLDMAENLYANWIFSHMAWNSQGPLYHGSG